MKLYWKNIEIRPGMTLAVVEQNYEVLNNYGNPARIVWKILDIKTRNSDEDFYEPKKDKTYPLKKVMNNRRLSRRKSAGEIIHIPPCINYLVVEEYHDGIYAFMRCYNVDMLELIRHVEIV